ncbi:flavocytochrome c [Vagococcus intermedius]|uniref:Flavocytochrome c n=1 Tax=Vagococcus intermedius TaxID=2991418 RepID=A0AAF0CUS2_9ENTE|nr:flavocytochrome c [Vagococcus intermedius]WEG73280.1 flavocytochrome c [Vagococcus intermedius]WEG75361.1 flavocytochrome c [Vagococcus intermedius]
MKSKLGIGFASLLSVLLLATGCGNTNQSETSSSTKKMEKTEKAANKETDTTSGASEQKKASLDDLKDRYDVVIVGAGGGGMAAAIEAKEQGMNPVILEKMPVAGGNTVKASAGMNASETKFQKEAGIKDSNDLFFDETLKGGKETNDQELLRYFVDSSANAIDWLDSMGITLNNLTVTGGMSVKRTHRPADGSAVGQYLVQGLLRNVQEREIPLYTDADVKEIENQDGAVSGVKVIFNNTDEKEIKTDAVVVATGGFGANLDMVTDYNKDLDGFVTTNQAGSQGDGIKMIEKMGGTTVDMKEIQIHPTVEQETSFLITEAVRGEGALLINQSGQRFVNELETRDNVSAAIIALKEHAAYLVFDEGVKERVTAIDFYEKQGFVKKADTIEELAKEVKMDEKTLTDTLSTWNTSVTNKKDGEFNRTTGMDHDLSKAPYYAIKIAPGIHHTMGGAKINNKTQVLNKDGEPVKGLYAAGEASGGLHGQNRIGGNAVADIIIYGRQAGTQSAEFVKSLEK